MSRSWRPISRRSSPTRPDQHRRHLHDLGVAHRHYKLRATGQGFQAYETNEIQLESGQIARVNIPMQLGFEQRVEVSGVTPILQTPGRRRRRGRLGDDDSGHAAQRPQLLAVVAAIARVSTPDPNSFTEPKNFGSGRPIVNGQREQANNYTLDGVDMNEPIDNLLPYQPSPDALAEVQVQTNNYSAEFGNVAGALIGSTIKSGTNEIHGSGFEYWRDSSMAANTWENNRVTPAAKKAELEQHIFGADHRRSADPEQGVLLSAIISRFIRSPRRAGAHRSRPEAWRRGDFSGVGVTIRDPATGQPFLGNGSRRRDSARSRATSSRIRRSIRGRTGLATATIWSRRRRRSSARIRATSRSISICRTAIACLDAFPIRNTRPSRSEPRSRAI